MKRSATELMKELKYIEEEIRNIHQNDEEKSFVPVDKVKDAYGKIKLIPIYAEDYGFINNRNKINDLFEEEIKIKNLLSKFNNETKIEGYDYTISEGLIRISQLKEEIKVLSLLCKKSMYTSLTSYRTNEVTMYKLSYSLEESKKELRNVQRKLSALQVAIDKTNLNSLIEFN